MGVQRVARLGTSPVRLRGFMHTDRGLYRPGDKVHVKGLVRETKLGEPLAVPQDQKVNVVVNGPQGHTLLTTEAHLSPFGGFWFDIDVPGDARLGDYYIAATMPHGSFTRSCTGEEYRPATFEVNGTTAEPSIVSHGEVHGTVSANYFYGAPVRNGTVDLAVHSRRRYVTFDKLPEFQFGDDRDDSSYMYRSGDSQQIVTEDHMALDAQGSGSFTFSIGHDVVTSDADLLVRADVHAPSNEVISKSFTIPYFRSHRYFGIKSAGWFVDVKQPQKFQIVSVGPDGKMIDGPARVTVTRRDWNCVWEDWGYRGSYQCKDDTQKILEKTLQVAGKPAELEFTPATGGDYIIAVDAGSGDTQGDAAAAAAHLYAWGDDGGSWRSDDKLAFDIAADKKVYKAGDTANLILKTDLASATGLVTIERDGVIEQRLIDITPTTKRLQVPILASYAPNVYVSVALIQGRIGDGPRGKPRMRMGIANLSVRPEDNQLTVSVTSDKPGYRPGEQVTATVKVVDGQGKPVAAEVSITAADEGVLSLIAYKTPDPLPTFYAPWGLGVASATQLEYLRDIPAPNIERPATGGDSMGTVRSRFVASAVWVPGAVTDANGIATVTFTAPDNLTAFRMMAMAADRTYRFGSADKRFTISKPLQLLTALPRFVDLGDALHAGVVVHNETGKAGTATVKLVPDDHIKVADADATKTIAVPVGGRVPVLFDLQPASAGTSALTFSVAMNGESDAVRLELPVKLPGNVRTADIDHGAVTDAKTIAVKLPADAVPSSAQLIVSVDPDGLSGIEDGLADLIGYPYGCMEQTTSKMVAMIQIRELAESLAIDGLTGDRLDSFVKAGITRIGKQQTAYGGFSLWPGGEPNAFYTAYGLWGLYLAKQAGFPVDSSRIDEALAYLAGDGLSPNKDAPVYNEMGDLSAQAFAIYVRALYKDKKAATAATNLLAARILPVYGKIYAARALAASVGPKDPAVVKVVEELAALAAAAGKSGELIKEAGERQYDWYMSSDSRTTSAVLLGLVELDPTNPAIKPLVQTVMKHRRLTSYWDTHSNFYSLLALTAYAQSVTGKSPSVAVQLSGKDLIQATTLAGKHKMRVVAVPLTGDSDLTLSPKGEVAYNVAIRYRARPETIKAESHNMTITREYLDEAGKPKTSFKVGDVVVVKLHVNVPRDAVHVMVSDALPAGFEALNTNLATVAAVAGDDSNRYWWGDYRAMHDDRVDFASEYIYRDDFDYTYAIRADRRGQVRAAARDDAGDVRPADQRADGARLLGGEAEVRLRELAIAALRGRRLRGPRRALVALAGLGVGAIVAWHVAIRVVDFPAELLAKAPATSLAIADADGVQLREEATSAGTRERWVALDRISPYLVDATRASEDNDFYDHGGVDWSALARAGWLDMHGGGAEYGGSTITMQLVRILTDTPRKSVAGKLRQMVLAGRLERALSKRDILEQYLNRVFYGHGAWGAEQAAEVYFSKHAAELSLGEAAFLAVLPRGPQTYDPFRHEQRAMTRRGHILALMERDGRISAFDRALAGARAARPRQPQAELPRAALRRAGQAALARRAEAGRARDHHARLAAAAPGRGRARGARRPPARPPRRPGRGDRAAQLRRRDPRAGRLARLQGRGRQRRVRRRHRAAAAGLDAQAVRVRHGARARRHAGVDGARPRAARGRARVVHPGRQDARLRALPRVARRLVQPVRGAHAAAGRHRAGAQEAARRRAVDARPPRRGVRLGPRDRQRRGAADRSGECVHVPGPRRPADRAARGRARDRRRRRELERAGDRAARGVLAGRHVSVVGHPQRPRRAQADVRRPRAARAAVQGRAQDRDDEGVHGPVGDRRHGRVHGRGVGRQLRRLADLSRDVDGRRDPARARRVHRDRRALR